MLHIACQDFLFPFNNLSLAYISKGTKNILSCFIGQVNWLFIVIILPSLSIPSLSIPSLSMDFFNKTFPNYTMYMLNKIRLK